MANNCEYTYRQTAKIEIEKDRQPTISVPWLSLCKCIFAAFLSFSFLACLVTSKISLLAIGIFYNETRLPYKNDLVSNPAAKETTFIMMVLILMIPQLVSLLKGVWVSLFLNRHPWPTNTAIIVSLFAGFVEVACLSFFVLVILLQSTLTAPNCILIMNALFLVPVIWQIRKLYKENSKKKRDFACLVLALILELIGIILLTYHVMQEENSSVYVIIPISLLLLSLAWCPKMQKLQIEPRTKGITARVLNTNAENEKYHEKTARGKSTVISSLWKLLLTPFVAALVCYLFNVADLTNLRNGFDNFAVGHAIYHFMAQIFTSFLGYILGGLACSMCIQRIAFVVPLTFATPVAMALVYIPGICGTKSIPFICDKADDMFVIPLAICLWVAQILSTGIYVWELKTFIMMAKESSLFWLPSYNGSFLEQNLLLNRKNQSTDESHAEQRQKAEESRVFICTTMYRESAKEVKQLLISLHNVDWMLAEQESKREFEAHIFFDGAVKGDDPNEFVLQLIGLVPEILKVEKEKCEHVRTPYGMQFKWKLKSKMQFVIHLKDNDKVKRKKRWSQFMYMSYVLDYVRETKGNDYNIDNTFILATDGDVKFSHESVQALMDLMLRDSDVGAVCGRTNPMGSGPVVWYQIFDYAIGHWFQKVANHVLGSVLCSPGCFSVYRASAIKDVLPIYASKVDSAIDFLTKDMGEDRWLCTLMVQSGWRLEYCAAAEDSTFCPETFDEFFKQRRRWIPSTLANLIQLISNWKTTRENNDKISLFFIVYQALMVFSTVIAPSTVILVISGALHYAKIGVEDEIVPLILLTLVTFGFAFICLHTKQDSQLKAAKILTVAFALIMTFASVGMVAQIGADLALRIKCSETPAASFKNFSTSPTVGSMPCPDDNLPADISSLYLAGLIGIFVLAAAMHPTEAYCLIHGVWYLFCLPSGYLLLIIYSVCNITDKSWGTRETEEKTSEGVNVPWYKDIWNNVKATCVCCRSENRQEQLALLNDQQDKESDQENILENNSNGPGNDSQSNKFGGASEGSDSPEPVAAEHIKSANVSEDDNMTGRGVSSARDEFNKLILNNGKDIDPREGEFWKGLLKDPLHPESAPSGAMTGIKVNLKELRNSSLMVIAIVNAIWMIILVTLNRHESLKILGSNAVGFAFLTIYGFIIMVQFSTLIWHRLSTICHILARAPWKGDHLQMSWSFSDKNLTPEINEVKKPGRKCKCFRCLDSESETPQEETELQQI